MFRPDIEGLRAVAVLTVVVYHTGLPFLPHGYLGVDVFFVISGYLITALLLRELAATGTVDWPRFLARRVRRLLPAAVAVLLFVVAATWLLLPGHRGRSVARDVVAAALYVVNWVLADRSVDYLAQDALASPVQHYWSLSVEEQFYVVWPLCLVALGAIWRRRRTRPGAPGRMGPPRAAVAALLAALALPSLAFSLWDTAVAPDRAYFVTTTRAWELGLGAAAALWVADREPRGQRCWSVVGWAGTAVILGAAALLPRGTPWPGVAALLPTLGAGAVILSGWSGSPGGPALLLGRAPLVWVGGLSYSLYLWHWPMAVFARELSASPDAPLVGALLSVVPAWLGHRFLEAPVHHSRALADRSRLALAVGLSLSATAVAAAVPVLTAPPVFRTTPPGGRLPPAGDLGAGVLGAHPSVDPADFAVDHWGWLTPDPERAGEDRPDADVDRCQVGERDSAPVRCDFGVADGATTVALVGDSKAMQWLPALQREAPLRGWHVVTYGKSSCAFAHAETTLGGRPYTSCDAWNAAVTRQLQQLHPALVVTSGEAATALSEGRESRSALVAGLAQRWRGLEHLGIAVAVVGDNPGPPPDLDTCMARHPTELTRCAFDRADALARTGLGSQRAAALRVPGVSLIDLTPWICPVERCPVAIGNVVVHRPGQHLTATYARTLGPQLGEQLEAALHRGTR